MSTTRDHGNYVFQCDGCRAVLDTDTSNFEAARNLLRRAGWKSVIRPDASGRGDDAWNHKCRACQREAA